VAHPHHPLGTAGQVREERVLAFELEQGPPVLAVVRLLDQTALAVDEQPPDSTMPAGPQASMAARSSVGGWISQ
jgi:hypothetical protein